MFFENIKNTHPSVTALLKRGAISVARSIIPVIRNQIDKTVEKTIMKQAKSHG